MYNNTKFRNKKKDKRKNTFNKYGKNTTRGMRIKITKMDNENSNKKKNKNKSNNDKKKTGK